MWDGHLGALTDTSGPSEAGGSEQRAGKHGTPLLPTSYTSSTPRHADPEETPAGNRMLRQRFPSRSRVAQPTLSRLFSAGRLPRDQLIPCTFSASVEAPCIGDEQDEKRIELEPAKQHQHAEHGLLNHTESAVVARRPHSPKSGADTRHGRDRRACRCDEIVSQRGQQ